MPDRVGRKEKEAVDGESQRKKMKLKSEKYQEKDQLERTKSAGI